MKAINYNLSVYDIEATSNPFVYSVPDWGEINETAFIHIYDVNNPKSVFYKRKPPRLLTVNCIHGWTKLLDRAYKYPHGDFVLLCAMVHNGVITNFALNRSLFIYDADDGSLLENTGCSYENIVNDNLSELILKMKGDDEDDWTYDSRHMRQT